MNEIKTESYPPKPRQADIRKPVKGSFFAQNMRIRRLFKGVLEE